MAVAEDTSLFKLKATDEISGAADAAAGSLEGLRNKIDQETQALSALQQQMRKAQNSNYVDIGLYKQLKSQITDRKNALKALKVAYVDVGGSIDSLGKKKKPPPVPAPDPKSVSLFDSLVEKAKAAGGPLGQVAGAFEKITKFVGGNRMAAGIAGVAAAIVAVSVATAKAVKSLYDYATAQATARRSELARLEGLSKIWTVHSMFMGRQATSSKELQSQLDAVSAKVSISRDKVAGYQAQLYAAGLRGRQLGVALEGMALKGAAQGDEQASMFAGWAAYAMHSGQGVDKLTAKVRRELGPAVKTLMLDTEVQAMKAQEAYAALFRGLDTTELDKSKKAINDLFSQTTASGKVFSRVLTAWNQSMIDLETRWNKAVRTAALTAIIWFVKLELVFIRIKRFLLDHEKALIAVKTAVYFVAGALIAKLLPALISVGTALLPFIAWPALILLAVWGLGKILELGGLILKEWDNIDWADLGRAMLNGILDGMKELWDSVAYEAGKLGDSIIEAFTGKIDAHSPSRVFAKLGKTIPQGLVVGIKAGEADVAAAAKDIAPVPPATPGKPEAGPRTGNTSTINVGDIHVHMEGGTGHAAADGREIARSVKAEIERVLMGVAIQMGATPEET